MLGNILTLLGTGMFWYLTIHSYQYDRKKGLGPIKAATKTLIDLGQILARVLAAAFLFIITKDSLEILL